VKKLLVRLLLSLIIGGGMLYLAARKIDFGTTWSALQAASWWWLLPYFAVMAIQHFFRAWRWKYLLAPIHPVPFSRLLPVASVGFCAILALPLRMGELVRPYLIADPPHLRMSHAFGTLAVERVFDGLFLALTTFVAVTVAKGRTTVPPWVFMAGLIALAIFLAGLAVLVLALWQRRRAVELCRRLVSLFSPRLGDRVAQIASGVVEGFQVIPSWRRLVPYLGHTLAYWLGNGVSVWMMALSFDMDLGLGQAVALMAVVGVGIMIPAGPGFIGNFELFAEGALGLYVTPLVLAQRGAAFILTLHVTNVLWYAVTGALALLSPQVSFTRVWRASTTASTELAAEHEHELAPAPAPTPTAGGIAVPAALTTQKLDNPAESPDPGAAD
jgi:glycosyltransferase 2 family protein